MDKQYDERYRNVDEAICDSFFLLTAKKDPATITVSDICKKAGVVRSTFYNHYQDMPSLIGEIQHRSVEAVFGLMRDFHPQGDREVCESFYLSLCRYMAENSLLQQLIQWPDASASFYREAIEMFHVYVLKTSGENGSEGASADAERAKRKDKLSYAIAYSIGGAVGVLHKWAADGLREEPEAVAAILTDMFLKGPMSEIHIN